MPPSEADRVAVFSMFWPRPDLALSTWKKTSHHMMSRIDPGFDWDVSGCVVGTWLWVSSSSSMEESSSLLGPGWDAVATAGLVLVLWFLGMMTWDISIILVTCIGMINISMLTTICIYRMIHRCKTSNSSVRL